jgi:hypothetical protein
MNGVSTMIAGTLSGSKMDIPSVVRSGDAAGGIKPGKIQPID